MPRFPRPPAPSASYLGYRRAESPAPEPGPASWARDTATSPDTVARPTRTHAFEVIFKGENAAALSRARRWVGDDEPRPQGLVPRLGRAALVRPRAPSEEWWLGRRSLAVADVEGLSLLDGDGAAMTEHAVVVRGIIALEVTLADELEGIRAALIHLASRHKGIREALETTRDIQGDPLTPTTVLRGAISELLRAADGAGLASVGVRDTARRTLVRERRYRTIDVLGEEHLVLRLGDDTSPGPSTDDGSTARQVAYLPKDAGARLPLTQRFEGRAVVTVHPRHDPDEPKRIALRVHALARIHRGEH